MGMPTSRSEGPRFARHCLSNLARRRGQVELPHLSEVLHAKAAPEPLRQVGRESREKRLAIGGPLLATLFDLHDPAADLLVRGGHHLIDLTSGGRSGLGEEADDVVKHAPVASENGQLPLVACAHPSEPTRGV